MMMLSLDDAIKAVTMLLDDTDGIDKIRSCDVINNLKYAPSVEEIETAQKWISVKDRLPDKRGNYLVVHKSYAYVGISHFLTNLRDNGQFEYEGEPNEPGFYNGDGEGDWVERDITHWMPLPDLPKEDE